MSDFRENGRGIAAMLAASAGFILNDTLVKLASTNLPLGEIIFIRGLFAATFLGLAAWATGALADPRQLLHRAVLLRGTGETLATMFYLSALTRMPIANATAILQALPLLIVAVSAIFLRERVGWRRWSAVVVGFCGVLMIVRPGFAGFSAWSLVALLGVSFMVLRDLSTRAIPRDIHTFAAALVSVLMTALLLAPAMGVAEANWVWPRPRDFALLAAAACFLMIGFVFIIIAMRTGEMVVVAPFRYSIVIWAIVLGMIVWGEFPDLPTLAGIAILIATGTYTFLRERALAARRRLRPPSP